MDTDSLRSDDRAISPELGAVIMVGLVVVLAMGFATISTDFSDRLGQETVLDDEDACPGFQDVEFEKGGEDFEQLLQELQQNNCALWLKAGDIEEQNGQVTQWNDNGPNLFHATQDDPAKRPQVVEDSELGIDVLEFEADHSQLDEDSNSHPDPGVTDGDYLNIDRDVKELGVEESSGFVIVATLKVDEFDRGGTWTVGEAGVDGREFSMRTCSSYGFDGCEASDPEGDWRGQHWGRADIDFSTGPNSADEWLILTHAYDGDDAYIRVNGKEVARDSIDLNLSANRDIQIGRWERLDDDPHYYFDGRMAEVTVFDRELAEQELRAVEEYMSDEHNIPLDGPG
jgi:hypothetical protein